MNNGRHFIAFDTASEVSTACVGKENGKILVETKVLTTAKALKAFVRSVPRPREVIFEESCPAAWLYSVFEPISDKVTVCDPVKNAELLRKSKGDQIMARNLMHWGRAGLLHPVWHGGKGFQELRESLRLYQELTTMSTRLKNQIKAVYRSRGIAVGQRAYEPESRPDAIRELPLKIQEQRVSSLGRLLDEVTAERESALLHLVHLAKQERMFKAVDSIPGFGPIVTAIFVAEVGCPQRFRTRRQFWSYCGLSVVTSGTGEFYSDEQGSIKRNPKATNTRGLVRQYNRTLKYVFKCAANAASRGQLREQYQRIYSNTKNRANAQLTLARKLAAIALHVAKTGEQYDVKLAFVQQ